MKVFADLHHQDLYYSLQLLFEKRLGWELYRPIGLDWYHEGYWKVWNHIDTARQYLALDQAVSVNKDCNGNDLIEAYQVNRNYQYENGIYYVLDTNKDKYQRAITLDKFKEMKFDIILSSMPVHIQPFNRLIQLYQPQAKHIFQIGNPGWWTNEVKNIMCGTLARAPVPGTNVVYYHQEFDLDVFRYEPPTQMKVVNSYIHYMDTCLMNQYHGLMQDWQFTSYGASFPNAIHKSSIMAETIRNSGYTFHHKPLGDGYGHVIHNTYACGRPAIVNTQHYRNMLAAPLLEDMVTCIDTGRRTVWENVQLLRSITPENHASFCERAHKRFTEVVNFDQEEIAIRKFLENLI